MSAQPSPTLSPDEYLAFERESEARHEYLAGEVFAMSGASLAHNRIVTNLVATLHLQLRERGCSVFSNDMRVRVESNDLFTYPDLVALCDEPRVLDDALDTLLNPALIVEVLSPSTESYDRGMKFRYYRELESLREYVLVAQDRMLVEHYVRQADDRWLLTTLDEPDAVLQLVTGDAAVELRQIFERVSLTA